MQILRAPSDSQKLWEPSDFQHQHFYADMVKRNLNITESSMGLRVNNLSAYSFANHTQFSSFFPIFTQYLTEYYHGGGQMKVQGPKRPMGPKRIYFAPDYGWYSIGIRMIGRSPKTKT